MKKLKIGLVGCGSIAEFQMEGLMKVEQAELAAVCDMRRDLAEAMASKYGVKAVYTDYAEMLKSDIEAVIICTPNFAHCSNAVEGAQAKKHLLVQKPFAMNMDEAERMVNAAKENGIIMQAAFFERFYGFLQKIDEIVQSGEIGRPLVIRSQMSHTGIDKFWHPKTEWFHDKKKSGGGPLGDLGAHHFDVIRWLSRSEVEAVSASTQSLLEDGIEDNASITLKMKNGMMAQCFMSFTTVGPKGYCYERFEVYCEEGTLIYNASANGAPGKILMTKKDSIDFVEVPYENVDPWVGLESHFVDCVLNQKTPITTGEDGKICLNIIKKGYASAESGKVMKL